MSEERTAALVPGAPTLKGHRWCLRPHFNYPVRDPRFAWRHARWFDARHLAVQFAARRGIRIVEET